MIVRARFLCCTLIVCACLVAALCDKAHCDARKQLQRQKRENPRGAITAVPTDFGDGQQKIEGPPLLPREAKARLLSLASRGVVVDKMWEPKAPFASKRIYAAFSKPMTEKLRRYLSANGCIVQNHIAGMGFVVHVTQEGLEFLRNLPFVTGFAPILATDKLSERLFRRQIAPYAVAPNGDILLRLSFFKGVEYRDAVGLVSSVGGMVLSDQCYSTTSLSHNSRRDQFKLSPH